MILQTIYEEFLKHTNLSDAVYKAVFLRLQDVLQFLNRIYLIRFVYTLKEESLVISFNDPSTTSTPTYVTETIKNLFENFFTFPKESQVKLDLLYENIDLSIIHRDDQLEIPEQLKFLQKFKVFPFFIVNKNTDNYFDEFENLFGFLNFREPVKNIYSPLRQLFERDTAEQDVDSGAVSQRTPTSYAIMIEDLQEARDKIMREMDAIKATRDKLMDIKNQLLQYAHFQDKYRSEYSTLLEDMKSLKEQKNDYLSKYQDVLKLQQDLEGAISDLNSSEKKSDEIKDELKFYIDRKKFLAEKGSILTNTVEELSRLQDSTKVRITELENIFKSVEELSKMDLDELQEKLKDCDIKQERLHANIMSVDTNIKQAKDAQAASSLTLENATYSDHVMQSTMNQSIPDHLSKPEIPTSVLTVRNYLKYYFVYYCEKKEKELEVKKLSYNKSTIARFVLREKFGFTPRVLFSDFDIPEFQQVIVMEG
jgi:predicted  nucleic acid-binding Zn-ribbon protein